MVDLRTPKGTRDYSPRESFLLDKLVATITQVFRKHGAVSIDTPTFELREVLCNKYGEDTKLIFDLANQGGDLCSLRYDLTVSFARYLARNKIQRIKRFQIGKVFRRDQPSVAKGRLREFVQCDFDIAGLYLNMVADAEVICILDECLEKINIGYQIRINSRLILDAVVGCAGISKEKSSTVCSSIDKLDKISWEEVAQELATKGIDEIQVRKVAEYVKMHGGKEVLGSLKTKDVYLDEKGKKGIEDLELLMRYVELYGAGKNVVFDLSLARGLDYYTGVIFEAVFLGFEDVGSIAGGGRYDHLVSSVLNNKENPNKDVPCVGFSFGVTRILPILLKNDKGASASETKVFVGSSGSLLLEERLEVLRTLWLNDVPAETFYTKRYNFNALVEHVQKNNAPFFLVLGEKEIAEKKVKLLHGDEKETQLFGSLEEIIKFIKARI